MTRAELAAEVLRIHDLIAAEPGPRTSEEWKAIKDAVDELQRQAIALAWREMTEPQPHMENGRGLCTNTCSLYHPLDGISREHSVTGSCVANSAGTRVNVPCSPWVDGMLLERFQALCDRDNARAVLAARIRSSPANERADQLAEIWQELAGERAEKAGILARAERAEAVASQLAERLKKVSAPVAETPERPCENVAKRGEVMCRPHGGMHATDRPAKCTATDGHHDCGELTVCHNTSGYPLCRAHGGR